MLIKGGLPICWDGISDTNRVSNRLLPVAVVKEEFEIEMLSSSNRAVEPVRARSTQDSQNAGLERLCEEESCPLASQWLCCTTSFENRSHSTLTSGSVSATLLFLFTEVENFMVTETSAGKQTVVFEVICCQLHPFLCMLMLSRG